MVGEWKLLPCTQVHLYMRVPHQKGKLFWDGNLCAVVVVVSESVLLPKGHVSAATCEPHHVFGDFTSVVELICFPFLHNWSFLGPQRCWYSWAFWTCCLFSGNLKKKCFEQNCSLLQEVAGRWGRRRFLQARRATTLWISFSALICKAEHPSSLHKGTIKWALLRSNKKLFILLILPRDCTLGPPSITSGSCDWRTTVIFSGHVRAQLTAGFPMRGWLLDTFCIWTFHTWSFVLSDETESTDKKAFLLSASRVWKVFLFDYFWKQSKLWSRTVRSDTNACFCGHNNHLASVARDRKSCGWHLQCSWLEKRWDQNPCESWKALSLEDGRWQVHIRQWENICVLMNVFNHQHWLCFAVWSCIEASYHKADINDVKNVIRHLIQLVHPLSDYIRSDPVTSCTYAAGVLLPFEVWYCFLLQRKGCEVSNAAFVISPDDFSNSKVANSSLLVYHAAGVSKEVKKLRSSSQKSLLLLSVYPSSSELSPISVSVSCAKTGRSEDALDLPVFSWIRHKHGINSVRTKNKASFSLSRGRDNSKRARVRPTHLAVFRKSLVGLDYFCPEEEGDCIVLDSGDAERFRTWFLSAKE